MVKRPKHEKPQHAALRQSVFNADDPTINMIASYENLQLPEAENLKELLHLHLEEDDEGEEEEDERNYFKMR